MPCARCGSPFEPRRNGGKPQRYCSALCRKRTASDALLSRDPDYKTRWYRANADRWEGYERKTMARPGAKEVARNAVRKWQRANPEKAKAAQKRWQQNNPDKVRQSSRERHARKMAAVVELFDELEIFERDGWICQWCHEPVDPSLKGRHPMMKSLDHVIPLIRGGEHSRANTQLVHFRCNSAKKDR